MPQNTTGMVYYNIQNADSITALKIGQNSELVKSDDQIPLTDKPITLTIMLQFYKEYIICA